MTLQKSVWSTLLLLATWLGIAAATFSRNPNLSQHTCSVFEKTAKKKNKTHIKQQFVGKKTDYKVTFSSTNGQYLNGFYVKKKSLGIYRNDNCGDLNCTSSSACTWMFEFKDTSSSATYYLFEVYGSQQYEAVISTTPCDSNNWLAISKSMKKTAAMGLGQNFTLATQVQWKTQGSTTYNVNVGQLSICHNGQSGCNSPSPTHSPTKHPVKPPTNYPTIPTRPPTAPTRGPSKAPTTPKPTRLPTTPTVIYSSTGIVYTYYIYPSNGIFLTAYVYVYFFFQKKKKKTQKKKKKGGRGRGKREELKKGR
ncbi:hypothetical protein RFI_30149 [Reticulomyxa filosa]|uniref:Uncharacterized protein n=1 Tax=Reticulomyxa filosa TaxID=46433 RepID=X6M1E4_RETFI|nr:hypothetical protein RFI_30149 [Reticulomyxa filosa]|eukprot:ETO07242.1 hypothetical protein RFI_30149 [Reticulomyxa filosa]